MAKSTLISRLIRTAVFSVIAGFVLIASQDVWRPLLSDVPEPAAAVNRGAVPKGVPVIAAKVTEAQDNEIIQAIGTARARRSVMLFPEAAGEIMELQPIAGRMLEKDDIILRLDNRAASLEVLVAETHVREAERELARAQKLKRSNVRSAANVEDAEIYLERAKLQLSQAREALADRTLRAPFEGVIGIPKVEVGDRVTTETDITSIDDRSTLLVEVEVAERYFNRLKIGKPVSAQTPTFAGRTIMGEIEKIDSRIDPIARTALIRIAFPNDQDDLRPGMSFAVTIELPGKPLVSVPELSLQWRNGQSFVWRLFDGLAARVDVTVIRRLNQRVLVEADLQPGQEVAVEGVQRLRDGISVYLPADNARGSGG